MCWGRGKQKSEQELKEERKGGGRVDQRMEEGVKGGVREVMIDDRGRRRRRRGERGDRGGGGGGGERWGEVGGGRVEKV